MKALIIIRLIASLNITTDMKKALTDCIFYNTSVRDKADLVAKYVRCTDDLKIDREDRVTRP